MRSNQVSRRNFLKGAMLGGMALTMETRWAMAEQMLAGRPPRIGDIRSIGIEPGRIKLDSNENPLGPSHRAVQAVAEHMFDINRYGGSYSHSWELIEALGQAHGIKLQERHHRSASWYDFPPNPFIVTTGSGDALELISLACLCREGGEVVEADPGYSHGISAKIVPDYPENFGVPVNLIRVPLTKDYKHDLNAMLNAVTPNTTLAVITNPNNPTGTIVPYEAIEHFVDSVPPGVLVVIDEAYIHFVDDPNYPSAVRLALTRENVMVTRTFSKIYGLVQLRLGYTVSSQTVKEKVDAYGTSSINRLSNVAGIAALQDMDHARQTRRVVKEFKQHCYKAFDIMGLEYVPSQSNFIMVNVRKDAGTVEEELEKRHVEVSRRGLEDMKTWLRVSAGTKAETEVFLSTLRAVLTEMG